MSRMPLAWHKQCLENMARSVAQEREQLDRAMKRYERDLGRLGFYRMQVESAIAEERDAFDGERYKVKKEKKIT